MDSFCWICNKAINPQSTLTICEECDKSNPRYCWTCEKWDECQGKALLYVPRCECGGPMLEGRVMMPYAPPKDGFVCPPCNKFVESAPPAVGVCMRFEQRAALVPPEIAQGRLEFHRWRFQIENGWRTAASQTEKETTASA